MKQLDLFKNATRGLSSDIPDFENSHERRTFGEKPYNRMKATSVYADLIESDFFRRYKKGGK